MIFSGIWTGKHPEDKLLLVHQAVLWAETGTFPWVSRHVVFRGKLHLYQTVAIREAKKVLETARVWLGPQNVET